ncbi:MAG: rod-binding protein [Deltaproteobacteria bacterium]|nr:rod-binding protein [Deltaproteobacteria bacterium]
MKSIAPPSFQFQKIPQAVDNKNERQFADSLENKKLLDACKDFEAILLNKMFSTMRESIPEGGLFEKSFGEKIYQSMLDEEMTKEMAHGKGIGIGELLYRSLSRKINHPADEGLQK